MTTANEVDEGAVGGTSTAGLIGRLLFAIEILATASFAAKYFRSRFKVEIETPSSLQISEDFVFKVIRYAIRFLRFCIF